MRLIDRAARQGVKQFIFASSASVYGVKSEPRVTEDLELFPISEYNKTKMVAERVVLSYADAHDRPRSSGRRPSAAYSPRMRLDLVVNLLTMQALTEGRDDGARRRARSRPNIHIDDLVDVYLFAFEQRLAGVYNAGFENLSVLDIARRIASHVPAEVQILPSNDPRSYRSCSDRLLAAGFAPARTVSTAIDEMAACTLQGGCDDDARVAQRQLDETAQPVLRPREQEDSGPGRRRRRLVDGLLPDGEGLRRHRHREEQPRRRPGADVLLQRPPVRVRPAHLVLARRRGRSGQQHHRQADQRRAVPHRSAALHLRRGRPAEVPLPGALPGHRPDAGARSRSIASCGSTATSS